MDCGYFKEKYDLKCGCCQSCHEDYDLGFDGCFIRDNGKEYEACCDVYNELERLNLIKE